MLVLEGGKTVGTIGGGALEYAVAAEAVGVITSNVTSIREHRLVRDHNMCCGGTVQVFVEPVPIPAQLFLFGAGHVNRALAQHAALLDFEITVIDERAATLDTWPSALARIINASPRAAMERLAFDAQTYVMIATHSHPLDREVLRLCIDRHRAFLGMIGSARKAAVTRALFLDQQWATEQSFDAVALPAGLAINALSPHEIAISILGHMVGVRAGGMHAPSAAPPITTALDEEVDLACVGIPGRSIP